MISCIPKDKVAILKAAIAKEGITIEKLVGMTSATRQSFFNRHLGEKDGKDINVLFEKALVSNQKQAISDWIWKNFVGHKPLYTNISLRDSKAMADAGIKVSDLKRMTPEQRVAKLNQYVGLKEARVLNERFENATKTGTLSNWEERVIGTKEVHADKKLKGAFARLEALDDTGLLTPKQTEKFMEGLVSHKLGIEVTPEQSARISEHVKEVSDAFEKVRKLDNWVGKNRKDVVDYFTKREKMEKYMGGLTQGDAVDVANNLVSIMRNNILGSWRTVRNSSLYQAIPSLERAFTKRLVSPMTGEKGVSFYDKLAAKIAVGLIPSKEGQAFINDQLKLTLEIYHKTGYDISRMQNLYTGQKYIGEKERTIGAGSLREAKGIVGKTGVVTGRIARATSVFPKWFAGGTDTVIAATTRAETSWLWSREIARVEARTGKLPEGVTEKQRADQLLKDSYSFDPKDPKAIKIKEAAINDANFSNNTQPDGLGDTVVKIRSELKIGGVEVGRVIAPFAKISTTAISRGLKVATPVGVAQSVRDLHRASRESDPNVRSKAIAVAEASLIGYLGLTGTAVLISALLDEDDYIPPYLIIKGKEYELAKARGASSGSIRIPGWVPIKGGDWLPLRYLVVVGPTISGIMNARQAKSKGDSPVAGYVAAMLAQVIEIPVIQESFEALDNIRSATSSKEAIDIMDSFGWRGEKLWDYARVRVVPATLSRDVYDAVLPPEKNFDFLGREVDSGGAFRNDKTNDLLIEFSRLDRAGYLPTIQDPRGKNVDAATEKVGEQVFNEKLNDFKNNYARRVEELIETNRYRMMSDEDKQKAINEIRTREINKRIESLAKFGII